MESTIRWNAFQRVRETRAILAGRVHVLNILQHPFSPDNLCVFFRKIIDRLAKKRFENTRQRWNLGEGKEKRSNFCTSLEKWRETWGSTRSLVCLNIFDWCRMGKKDTCNLVSFENTTVLKFVIIKKWKIVIKYFIEKGLKHLETFLANRIVQLQ